MFYYYFSYLEMSCLIQCITCNFFVNVKMCKYFWVKVLSRRQRPIMYELVICLSYFSWTASVCSTSCDELDEARSVALSTLGFGPDQITVS